MNPTPDIADRFVTFLETTENPGDLFTAGVFCDFNVPRWRYQFKGVEELANQIRHDKPNVITVRHVEPTPSGFVLEAEADVQIDGKPYYERTIWLVTTTNGCIAEVTLYCSGEWDTETRARQQREAPMLRP